MFKWSKGCSFSCCSLLCLDSSLLARNSCTAQYSVQAEACTEILSGWCGRSLQVMTALFFSNGTMDSRRVGLQERWPASSLNRPGVLVTQPHAELVGSREGEGRPGPKSRAEVVSVFWWWHSFDAELEDLPLAAVFIARHCVLRDVRVRGSAGRRPLGACKVAPRLRRHLGEAVRPPGHIVHGEAIGHLAAHLQHVKYVDPQTSTSFFRSQELALPLPAQAILAHAESAQLPADCKHAYHSCHSSYWVSGICTVLVSLVACRVCLTYRNTSTRWFVTRVCPGQYRRRPGRLIHPRTPPERLQLPPQGTGSRSPQRRTPSTIYRFRCFRLWFLLAWLTSIGPSEGYRTPPSSRPNPMPSASSCNVRAYGALARQLSFARKRSFKRAQLRAMRDRVAAYRGRIHDPQSLSLQYIGKDPQARKPASTSPRPANTLRVVTWNCGGLHQVRYAELLAWLDEQDSLDPVHVMCIQETHWPYHAEYSSGSRQFVHSSSGTASGGVLNVHHT